MVVPYDKNKTSSAQKSEIKQNRVSDEGIDGYIESPPTTTELIGKIEEIVMLDDPEMLHKLKLSK
jgi:hypothetical protein